MKFFSGKDEKEKIVEKLLLENYNRYYRLAYSYVHNEADAADLVQNGAYKAILNSGTLKHVEFAGTWLYRIMLNEIFLFLRKRPEASVETVLQEQGAEDVYEDVDLKRALNAMSKEDKAVIELKYFEERTLNEIAEILGENINTVKSRLYRGLKKLRLELSGDVWSE